MLEYLRIADKMRHGFTAPLGYFSRRDEDAIMIIRSEQDAIAKEAQRG